MAGLETGSEFVGWEEVGAFGDRFFEGFDGDGYGWEVGFVGGGGDGGFDGEFLLGEEREEGLGGVWGGGGGGRVSAVGEAVEHGGVFGVDDV